jgi:ABC-type polar amino acid transport system ATPase subunit
VKTIKNCEDPNVTNPVLEEEEQESIASQEGRTFDESVAEQPSPSREPPTEEISEESDHLTGWELTQQLSLDESLHTSPHHFSGPLQRRIMIFLSYSAISLVLLREERTSAIHNQET